MPDYHQIIDRGHPLPDLNFPTRKEARDYLRGIAFILENNNNFYAFHTYEVKLPHLPIVNALYLRRTFADGYSENVTLTIKHADDNVQVFENEQLRYM